MIKTGLAIILATMSLYASTPSVEQQAGIQEAVEKQKKLFDRYERTQRPVEKAHALKVYKEYTAKAKTTYGENSNHFRD
jgi:hypothetical protein